VTLGIGIVTPRGVVIATDGLLTVGTIQVPGEKVFTIGQAYGIGLAGSSNMMELAVRALRASPLAQDPPHSRSSNGVTIAARGALREATNQYLTRVSWSDKQTIDSQIGSAVMLFGGLCSDGPFLGVFDNRGNAYTLIQPHYHAIGSALETALVLLRAYAAYDYATHPLDTSVLIAKRVIDQVSAAIPAIGGDVRILAISQQADPTGQRLRMIDPNSPLVQDGLTTWQVLESEMFTDLAAWANPPADTPQEAPPADGIQAQTDPPAGGAPAADLPPHAPHS
jgi:20S proteasome alpha/beta subunit